MPRLYADVPDEQWNNWRWQLSNRINSVEEFERVIPLTEGERKALSAPGLFRVDITPYFISLIDPDDPNDPVRKQVVPTAAELVPFTSMMEDSLAEDRHSPVPGLVHRYPDRVLMLVTTQCASYCRYCTRSRIVGDPAATFSRAEFEMQIEYLKRTPQVRDVLLSGGDPLVLAPKILEEILRRLREIPHIEIVRIGSRVPVFLPMRVTHELSDMLQKYHPLWLNIHVNHPNEISRRAGPGLRPADARRHPAGQPVGAAGGRERQRAHPAPAGAGAGAHPRAPVLPVPVRPGGGRRSLPHAGRQGHRDHGGAARPHLRLRRAAVHRGRAGGGGKIPVLPNYLLSMSDHKIVLRNYEGYVTTYEEPTDYTPAMSARYLGEKRPEPGQAGVHGLLEGEEMFIKPEGFDEVHDRSGIQHRLKDERKWVPLGIGEGKKEEESSSE